MLPKRSFRDSRPRWAIVQINQSGEGNNLITVTRFATISKRDQFRGTKKPMHTRYPLTGASMLIYKVVSIALCLCTVFFRSSRDILFSSSTCYLVLYGAVNTGHCYDSRGNLAKVIFEKYLYECLPCSFSTIRIRDLVVPSPVPR